MDKEVKKPEEAEEKPVPEQPEIDFSKLPYQDLVALGIVYVDER